MTISVIGINHKSAPIHLREQLYFPLEKLPLYLQDLLNREVTEAVLLSTCNRSELYCETSNIEATCAWFLKQANLSSQSEIKSAMYVYSGQEAIAHMMTVSAGLDSMILGETQILGQMKEAFAESCTALAVGTGFHKLFQHIFAVAKEIRTTTAIGACPVSVASAAIGFAKQQCASFKDANILLIGAGTTSELLLRYLKSSQVKSVQLVNRTFHNATALMKSFPGLSICSFNQLTESMISADIIFSATGSANYLVNKEMVARVMQSHAGRPLFFIDIAVPRDIDPRVSEIDHVQLFCIDDLKIIIEKNRLGREHAADKARELIQQKSYALHLELKSHDKVSHTIRAYRGQIEEICRDELIKAKEHLRQGKDPLEVLEFFAQAFTKKLLHAPSKRLREAGEEGHFELLSYAKQLFAIPDV